MTYKYNNVYVLETATIAGPYEKEGPLKTYFDYTIDTLYDNEKTWEKAEAKLSSDSINMVLNKSGISKIDLIIGGDLSNQIASSCFASSKYNGSFLGIYSACATVVEGIIIGSSLIDGGKINNSLVVTSSHNMASEKQFRNPTEYGAPKPKTATFTSTGAASIILASTKTPIKVESSTIGRIVDMNQKDALNMGAVMAPAAALTIHDHLKDLNRSADYYDLILTGDLGKYGKEILIDLMKEDYNINLKNYSDCGVMLYDLDKQKYALAGGSGPVCSALVSFSYIMDKLKKKELKKVLVVATGALFSPTTLYQHENILSIAHAVSLEVV